MLQTDAVLVMADRDAASPVDPLCAREAHAGGGGRCPDPLCPPPHGPPDGTRAVWPCCWLPRPLGSLVAQRRPQLPMTSTRLAVTVCVRVRKRDLPPSCHSDSALISETCLSEGESHGEGGGRKI